jgi:hypothetical protein
MGSDFAPYHRGHAIEHCHDARLRAFFAALLLHTPLSRAAT